MPIIVKRESNFTPAPGGTFQAVCVDVEDLGMQETTFGHKHMVRIVWQLSERMPDNRPFIASKRYNASFNEAANLRLDLESWRGRPFTDDELAGFDLEKLIGVNCLLNIVQEKKGDKTFSNVKAVTPLVKGMPPIKPENYTRKVDREPTPPSDTDAPPPVVTDDDIPF
jgi:hypothetical protein